MILNKQRKRVGVAANTAIPMVLLCLAPLLSWAVTFNMLSCCPGEQTATEARFVWHSDSDACTLWYAKASTPSAVVQVPCESVHKPVAFRSSDVNYYKYTAELSALEPGTEYIYYVKSGSSQSGVQRFKTAGTSGSYNFLWLSDVHSHPDDSAKTTNSVNTIIANAKMAAGALDFILFSGDMVKYGGRYDNWQQWNGNASFTDYMHALCPGNKEYYYNGTQTGPNGSSNRIHNRWFLSCRNNPTNGADGIESTYWFIRDGVMFVAMDTLADEGVEMDSYVYNNSFALQTNWFDRVVSAQRNAKSFRYLVVFQHYPHFTYTDNESGTSVGFKYGSGRYKKWKSLFDKHKVDFALTGDHHNYSRSKQLRGDSENSEGTVYITAPEIGTSLYNPSVKTASSLNSYGVTSGDNPAIRAMMATAHNGNEAVGGVWFSVTPQKMTMHYIGRSSSPYDTAEVTPKDRGFVYDPSGGGGNGGDATAHRRFRFAVDAPRSDSWCMQLSEIELLDADGNVVPPSAFTLAYDSTTIPVNDSDPFPAAEGPDNAADGVHTGSGKWLDWRAGLSESAAVRSAVWIDFCFAEPTAVSGYQWYTAGDNGTYSGRTPVSWTFSASDDGGTTWNVLDKVEGYDTTTDNNALAYSKVFVLPPATESGMYYGLAVGVNKYADTPDGSNNLNGCVADAEDVLSAMTNALHGMWSPQNCYSLYDYDATLSAVRSQFQSLAAQAQSGDTVIYYQSSHGWGDDNKLAALCMTDEWYWDYDFASDLLRFKTGVRVIVVIDACNSGGMFKAKDGEASASSGWDFAASVEACMAEIKNEMRTKGVKAANSPSVGWITACDYNQTSLEVNRRGWFTVPFVRAWKADATDANGDGYNDFVEMFTIAAPQATDASRQPQKLNDSVLASVAAWRNTVSGESGEFTWKGGYDDNRISSARNWEEGVAPSANSSASLVFPFTQNNTTVTNDYASLSVKSIVFPASTSRASFVGGSIEIEESIVNNASVTNKFKNAVTFSGPIDVTGEMDFPGGVTGTVPANHTTYRGNYNLTTTGDWTSPSDSRVPSGSTFSMPSGTFYCNAGCMTIEKTATVVANAAKMNRTTTGYLLQENDGVFKTTGVLTSSGSGAVYHYLVHTSYEAASEGLIALGGLKIDGAARPYANSYGGTYQMAIGDNGIKKKAGATGYFLIRNDNKPEYIGSWCNGNDYKIAIVDSNGQYPLDTQEYVLYGSRTDRAYNINFDTTDCFNAGVRNTVRDMSPICGAVPANVSVGIYGSGTFRFENTAVNATGLYAGGTVVSNSATVAILAGSCPGRGDLSLRDTATLSIPDSAKGTANVFGTLIVNAGTSLVFAGLASGTTPLSIGGLTVGEGEQKPVISVNASGLAAGTYPLIASSSATVATADTFTLSASGASDKTLALVKSGNSICLEVSSGVHGKWLGGNGGNRFSVAANWGDGRVPSAGDALDFSSVTSATTIEADVDAAFGAVTMGAGVVTFTGNLTATSFSDTSKIAVGANATVTLVGDLVFAESGDGGWMLNRLDGTFIVNGDIVVSGSADMKLAQSIGSGGVAVVKGLVSGGNTVWTFRLNRSNSGDVARWVIGENGLSGNKGFWMLAASSSSSAILQPNTNDFTIADWIGARSGPTLTVNTTGWGDSAGHVVTATAGFIREGRVDVTGTGTLVCDYDASAGAYDQTAHSVSFYVMDAATLSLVAGSNIGTGGVTVNGGASLAVSGAGTATLGGTLTLQGGSRLVVGAADVQGYSRLSAKNVSLAGNITVGIPSQTIGTFPVLTRTNGSFSDADLGKLSLLVASPDASLTSSLVIADGGKSIAVSTAVAWPANWNGGHAANVAMQAAFAEWAATPGNDATAARAEGAFLLGLDLADYAEDLKIVSVAMREGKFTIDTNVDLTKVRGRLYVLVADSPMDIERLGTKINGTVSDLSKLVGIDASAPARFFKVGVDYAIGE